MPLNDKGQSILQSMKDQYGSNKGKRVFYASKNKGTISGVEKRRQQQSQHRKGK